MLKRLSRVFILTALLVLMGFGISHAQSLDGDTVLIVKVKYESPVWYVLDNPTFKVEFWIYCNFDNKGIQAGFRTDRQLYLFDSVKIGAQVCMLTSAYIHNDDATAGMTYFSVGGAAFPPICNFTFPKNDTILLCTSYLSFKADSLNAITDPLPLDSLWLSIDSTFFPPAGDFIVTDSTGKSIKPTLLVNDTILVRQKIAVTDIHPTVIPQTFELKQNHPNPFNPSCEIEFAVPTKSRVNLAIYNTLGQKVRTLVDEELDAGWKSVTWDGKSDSGSEVASGIYLYRINAGNYSESKKMIMLK